MKRRDEVKPVMTVKEAQKDLNDAIDREMAKAHAAIKPYWEQLDKAWADVKSKDFCYGR